MGNFDIFVKPLSDFIVSAHERGPQNFRRLDREQLTKIVRSNTFTSNGPLLRSRIVKS